LRRSTSLAAAAQVPRWRQLFSAAWWRDQELASATPPPIASAPASPRAATATVLPTPGGLRSGRSAAGAVKAVGGGGAPGAAVWVGLAGATSSRAGVAAPTAAFSAALRFFRSCMSRMKPRTSSRSAWSMICPPRSRYSSKLAMALSGSGRRW
jgi:hypothetical protein